MIVLYVQVMALRCLPVPALGYEATRHVTYLPIFSADGKLFASFFFIEGVRRFEKFMDAWPEAYMIMTESGGIDNSSWMSLYDKLEEITPKPCTLLLDGHGTRHSDQRRLHDGRKIGLRINLGPRHPAASARASKMLTALRKATNWSACAPRRACAARSGPFECH